MTLENLVPILRWSEQPHGSAWVHRQALQFLREEFQAIANSPVLYELDKSHMIDALQSDFLQASELDVLQAVLKWGEHQLMKRMEERGKCKLQRPRAVTVGWVVTTGQFSLS